MAVGVELAQQRRLTTAFINTAPVTVSLVPRSKVRKPAGGFGWREETPRPGQVMRLIEPGVIPLPVVTIDGVERQVEFELLAEYNAAIGPHDVFELDGSRYEVAVVAHPNGWEQRALVNKFDTAQGTVAP